MSGKVSFYHPGKEFPSFSVTGEGCALQCEHCRGRYLRGMRAILTPAELKNAAQNLVAQRGIGFLLSGGCDLHGRVPLGPFCDTVRDIKTHTDLVVNLHPGLLDEGAAASLLDTAADAYSVDVVQDPRTIAGTLHLQADPKAYVRTLELLAPSGRLVPHVCVGLQSEKGEEETLEIISTFDVKALIVLGLVGARGTPREQDRVPSPRLSAFIRHALEKVDAPVLLGCMRPRGEWEVEVRAIEDGVPGVVNPSSRTVAWARNKGYTINAVPTCCALHL